MNTTSRSTFDEWRTLSAELSQLRAECERTEEERAQIEQEVRTLFLKLNDEFARRWPALQITGGSEP